MLLPNTVPFAVPDVGEAEIDAVVEVLGSRWLTTGKKCRDFEERFAESVNATYAVALNSCTAALHLSLEALGVTAGDRVYMSPYTFAATAEVVRYLDATPVFVDIDPVTLNIDVSKLREAVERDLDGQRGRPRAVIPVHIAGIACDMDEIWRLARDTDIAVIEDAAHAFPAHYAGRSVGSIPEGIRGTACFSFYATKTLTTGEGGMVTTEDPEVADRIRTMSLHGLSRQAWSRYESGGSWAYDIVAPGYKYNLTDVAAAMGLVQLDRAREMLDRRRQIARAYNAAFSDSDGLDCPIVPKHRNSAWHLYVLRLNRGISPVGRDDLVQHLNRDGIGASVHFIPLHLHSYYRDAYDLKPFDFPQSLREYERSLSLPIYSAMSDTDVEKVIDSVLEAQRA